MHRIFATGQYSTVVEQVTPDTMRLEAVVGNMSEGVCMFDAAQRLVICNERYVTLYDLPAELARAGVPHADIVAYRIARGMRSANNVENFEALLLQSIKDGVAAVIPVQMIDGRRISIHHQPMPDGGWLATHRDVTEDYQRLAATERREQEYALQNMRLEAAVNNMSQGLCMFNAERRLVICNKPYVDIYELPPSLIGPGTTLEEILSYRLTSGMMVLGGNEAYVRTRIEMVEAGVPGRDIVELTNGRVILIQHHPMLDGGWVSTHEDITEQRKHEAHIRHLARHDTLTDLPNRLVFNEEVALALERLKHGQIVSLMCVDLDQFKAINDTLGHGFGDAVLIETAGRLRRCIRENDMVARLGGDEFVILTGPLDGAAEAEAIADGVVRALAEPFEIEDRRIFLGGSVGIAVAPDDAVAANTLMRLADLALYQAKNEGKSRYHFFEKSLDKAMHDRRAMEAGLKMALAGDEFRLMYQPQIDLADNHISCLEALIRWEHPERGMIQPSEFIPIAEDTGIIAAIGEWVLRQACQAAASWPAHVSIAVNLSSLQLRRPGLVDLVVSALDVAGLAAHRLEIEVTESVLLEDTQTTIAALHELRALGIRIAIDDFGIGYSSLSYLLRFPFDKIKIDRSFVAATELKRDSHPIIRAIVGLSKGLGMTTIAEGVETEAQLDAVRAEGCDEAQGFLFSPPLSAAETAVLFENAAGKVSLPGELQLIDQALGA